MVCTPYQILFGCSNQGERERAEHKGCFGEKRNLCNVSVGQPVEEATWKTKGVDGRTVLKYSKITSTRSPSFCMTTFSASLTNLTALPPKSDDCSCCVGTGTLVLPPLWLQKHTDLRAHDLAHSAALWLQPSLANVTGAWSWRLCGIYLSIIVWKSVEWINLAVDRNRWRAVVNGDTELQFP